MKLITSPHVSVAELEHMSVRMSEKLVKAVVDIEKGIMMIDPDMHADAESVLLASGSKQQHLWGVNLKPALFNTDQFVEFDSMINIRPSDDNRTRGVDNPKLRQKIVEIVMKLVA